MTHIAINTNQAKGVVSLFQSDTGVDVIVNGRVVATIDLSLLSERGEAAGIPPGCFSDKELRQCSAVRMDDDDIPVIHILPEPKMNVLFVISDGEEAGYAIFPDTRVSTAPSPTLDSRDMVMAYSEEHGVEFVHEDWVAQQAIVTRPVLTTATHKLYKKVATMYNASIQHLTSFDKEYWHNIRNGGNK